jgi:dTDP-4-dehydrorhamnose reductase
VSWCGFAQEIVEEIAPRLGKRVPVRPIATADYPTPARRPANSRLACGKIKAAFGIEQPDWRASLPAMLDAVSAAGVA